MGFAIDLLRELASGFSVLEPRSKRTVVAVLATAGLGCLVLCWSWLACLFSAPTARHGLRGRVAYAGRPLPLGEICLELVADPLRSRPAAPIIDGEFQIPPRGGLIASERYRILVVGYEPIANPAKSSRSASDVPIDPQMMLEYEQMLPACYNTESTLVFEATPGNLRQGLALQLD